jgi:hypothetical protein
VHGVSYRLKVAGKIAMWGLWVMASGKGNNSAMTKKIEKG